jgi:hypothetical protein
MPFVDKTWVAEELVDAVDMNLIRDNFRATNSYPAASVTHSDHQVIPLSAWTAVAFDTERYDTDAIHDNATNNSRLTCKTAGKYEIGGRGRFDLNNVGWRHLLLKLNGATDLDRDVKPNHGGVVFEPLKVGATCQLAVNDYVQLFVFQDTGAGLGFMKADAESPEFWMHRRSE